MSGRAGRAVDRRSLDRIGAAGDAGGHASDPGPLLTTVVGLEEPAPVLSARASDGTRYRGARIFATRGGRLVGEVRLTFDAERIDADRVGAALAGQLPGPASGWPELTPLAEVELPLVSVVVATALRASRSLGDAVDSLVRLDYPRLEVLVVDNRPGNAPAGTGWTPPADPRVRLLRQPRPGASAARNLGLAQARGEVIAFIDDDVTVPPGWLRALVGRLAVEQPAQCVTGPVLPAELATAAQIWFEDSGSAAHRCYRPALFQTLPRRQPAAGDRPLRLPAGAGFQVCDLRHQQIPARSVYALGEFGTGANMAFRTEALRRLGGFDEALGPGTPAAAGEDILLFLRILCDGGALAVEPAGYAYHRHRRDYRQLRTQLRGYGTGLTAMLTAAVVGDPRHLVGLVRVLPRAVAALLRTRPGRATSRPAGYPAALHRWELAGMLYGPVAYLFGRARARRRSP